MAPDWMNWHGWPWVFAPIQMAVGVAIGWSARGTRERLNRIREEIERSRNAGVEPHDAD